MFSFRECFVTILLLALPQSFVVASSNRENNIADTLAKMTVTISQSSWIRGFDLVIRASESSCADEIAALVQAVGNGYTWALQMLDASSKIQSGILKGNVRDLGMYDQCVEINAQYNDTDIRGKYCKVSFSTLSSAVCVPSSCNETQVFEIISDLIQNSTEILGLELEFSGVTCVSVDSEDFTVGEIATIIFFSTVVAFMVFCTICGFVAIRRPKAAPGLLNQLAKFSLYTNAISLLSTRKNPRMLPAIQGMRFLSICWVVLGHRFYNMMTTPMVNSLDIVDWYNSWTSMYVQAAPFAVDTFFVISGFLMTYLFMKSKQAGKRTNYPMMYIHRYLRLTPCLAVLMLFVAVLLHRVANGPLWNTILALHVEPCRKNWWVGLLYVQNLVRVEEMCLQHSWYLAVDMQLFWISPFILYPLHRWPKYGLGLIFLFLAASIVTPTVLLAMNSYSNALIRLGVPRDIILNNFLHYYIPTYCRACAYFVGLFLGYDVTTKKRTFSKLNVAFNWTVSIIFLAICGWSTNRVYNTDIDYNLTLEIVFAAILRPFWSVAIAWMVYASTHGHAGIVGSFLSLPLFLPLSRLSYCIYLVHMVIQAAKVNAERMPGRFTDFILFNHFWADLWLSIAVAFVLALFFESPMVVLEKMLTNPGHRRDRPSPKHRPEEVENKSIGEINIICSPEV